MGLLRATASEFFSYRNPFPEIFGLKYNKNVIPWKIWILSIKLDLKMQDGASKGQVASSQDMAEQIKVRIDQSII